MKIFDSHFHIIDNHFPLIENQGYIPNTFTSDDYLNAIKNLNIVGGAIVSGSFQGFDQSYLVQALKNLGSNFVGVTQLPASVSDEEIIQLNEVGVKAIRFNLKRGGFAEISQMEYLARRVFELVGWHSEIYMDSNDLEDHATLIEKLPAVSIDHLGLSQTGFSNLLYLVEKGVKVKATGFGRIDFDPCNAIKKIHEVNPTALMFGTDLPSTRAKRPFQVSDIDIILNAIREEANLVLYQNAMDWYFK
ncbi:amidohydrolase family protein [Niallia sp. HCP3S3_B10]|uniref:amidohydrolase family protein n=1 Tax=Bacillaceae TaxID=186817 RepID=UPI0024775288|nr:amidohydrolase family protein [Bacillus sp. T2.9-1]CAI9395489.1 hypothetical protein BACSP_04113 [Bacillus sp. T2.9-1]